MNLTQNSVSINLKLSLCIRIKDVLEFKILQKIFATHARARKVQFVVSIISQIDKNTSVCIDVCHSFQLCDCIELAANVLLIRKVFSSADGNFSVDQVCGMRLCFVCSNCYNSFLIKNK